ncbi:hypothetical protein AB0442_12655 [Kitasatospora sp. NPDC085895]|uniref:hypothetical protein n=1 Tax=Kitasatospora sp. NPDC085895 TaxID=3155057 RepID=UPI00344CE552
MTNPQDELIEAIRTLSGPVPARPAPVGALLLRGHRARRTRLVTRTAIGAGAFALAAAAVGVFPPFAGGSAAGPASPASGARGTGYRVTLTYTVEGPGRPDRFPPPQTYRGAADPASHRAQLAWEGGGTEWRILGAEEFNRTGGRPWHAGNPPVGPRGTLPTAGLVAVQPQELLAELRSRGTVTRTAGSGGSETYDFSYVSHDSPYTGERGTGDNTVTGRVELIGGRYRSVTVQTVLTGRTGDADPEPVVRRTVIDFFDYGIPVSVERPPLGG